MAIASYQQDAHHQGEDQITFAYPPYIAPANLKPPHAVDFATANDVTRGAAAPPNQQPKPPSRREARKDGSEIINSDITERLSPPKKENYWKKPQLIFRFLSRSRNKQSFYKASGSKFGAAWKKVRAQFSRKPSSISKTAGNDRQRSSIFSATNNDTQTPEAPNSIQVDETGTTNTVACDALPLNEVDILLAQHRSKLSAGHEGQLRQPPDPNDPATPPRPIPKIVETSPPQPTVPLTEPSDEVYTPGMLLPSSQADYLLDANAFYGGTSIAHNEDITSCNADQDAMEITNLEEPRCPRNSPVNNIISDETKDQMERNKDISHLFSEARYPSDTPLILGVSKTTTDPSIAARSTAKETITRRLPEISGAVNPVVQGSNIHYPVEDLPADSDRINDEHRFGVKIETKEVFQSDSSCSSDEYWLEIAPLQTRHQSQLNKVTETAERSGEDQRAEEHEEANYFTSQNASPDTLQARLEGIRNENSRLHTSSAQEDDLTVPSYKGKGVDRRAHPNYNCYVGYTRIRQNASDPGYEPGPSDWQTRPKLRDMPRDYNDD